MYLVGTDRWLLMVQIPDAGTKLSAISCTNYLAKCEVRFYFGTTALMTLGLGVLAVR
jgi:hypothetical protein